MRRVQLAALALVALAILGRGDAAAAEKAAVAGHALLGTWKQVSGRFNGKEFKPPPGTTLLKHVTSTQFMFVDYDKDGRVTDAFGGPYSLVGDRYEETPLYGVGDLHGMKGKAQSFRWRVEGNTWHHSGTLNDGSTLEEEWARVPNP